MLSVMWSRIALLLIRMVYRTATGDLSRLPPWFFAASAAATPGMFARKTRN